MSLEKVPDETTILNFRSFLAFVLLKELAGCCRAANITTEWGDLIRDPVRLQQAAIKKDGKYITTRRT